MLTVLCAIAEDLGLAARTHRGSEPSGTLVPGEPALSSDLCRC